MTQMPMVPTPATLPSLSQPTPVASSGVLCDQLTEEDSGLIYRWFCIIHRHHAKMDSYSTTAPFGDIPEGPWEEEVLPVSRASSGAPQRSLCLEGEMARCAIIYQFVGRSQWFG